LDNKLFCTSANNVPFSWRTTAQSQTASSLAEYNNTIMTLGFCRGLNVTFALLGRYTA